jgi:hypothetical protein
VRYVNKRVNAPWSGCRAKGVTDPAEMMRLLEQRYTSTGWNLKHKYLTEYNTLRVELYDSIAAFIDQYKVLKSKLDTIGLSLPEEVYTINFTALLDAQYPVWADRQTLLTTGRPVTHLEPAGT